jgi:hypothetical protein
VADEDDQMSEKTAFRDAIKKARREPVEVLPQFHPIATPDTAGPPAQPTAPAYPTVPAQPAAAAQPPAPVVVTLAAAPAARPRYEVRIEPLRGSRRRRERRLAKAGRKGWLIVAVVRDEAYLQRPKP